MGFDNECILNIQSLAGEYFCPVCRLLVYPNEAIQSQCTHLYCKPCLTYVVSTTKACPYDGYLVTEADSKPLVESNKALAETIGKIAVHCLYHRSGCTWQGPLSECTSHCSGCTFGNSPVVCNRCGVQIVHRQVQEHAQTCPGVQPQAQQADGAQASAVSGTAVATSDQSQGITQAGVATAQAPVSQATATPAQDSNQQANANAQVQAVAQAAVPTTEQWYQQQQYQQYYQQYPGYDQQYQQQYQQYYPYQQQAVQQYQQAQPSAVPGQVQPQVYPHLQPQPQAQAHSQPQAALQTQSQPQSQPMAHMLVHSQSHVQAPVAAPNQNPQQLQTAVQSHSQLPPQTHVASHGQLLSQPQHYLQSHPHQQSLPVQPPQHPQMPQQQQQNQIQYAQPQVQAPAHPQHSSHPLPQAPLQPQIQHHANHPQPRPHAQHNQAPIPNAPQSHSTVPAISGHHTFPQTNSYPQMPAAPVQHQASHMPSHGAPFQQQQHIMQPGQVSQAQVRPPQSHAPMANQNQVAALPSHGQTSNIIAVQQPVYPQAQQPGYPVHQRPVMASQFMHQQAFPSQPAGSVPSHLNQQGSFAQQMQQQPMQTTFRPQGQAQSSQHLPGYPQSQQSVLPHTMQSQQPPNHVGRAPNQGMQNHPFGQSHGGVSGAPPSRAMHPSSGSYPSNSVNSMQISTEQHLAHAQQSSNSKSVPTEKPAMMDKPSDYGSENSALAQEDEFTSENSGRKNASGSTPVGAESVEEQSISESDAKLVNDVQKHNGEESQAEPSSKDIGETISSQVPDQEVTAGENGSVGGVAEEQRDVSVSGHKQVEQSFEDKKIQEASCKRSPGKKGDSGEGKSEKVDTDAAEGGRVIEPLAGNNKGSTSTSSVRGNMQIQEKDFVQPLSHTAPLIGQGGYQFPPTHYGPPPHQQRHDAAGYPPGPRHQVPVPGYPPPPLRPQGPGPLAHGGQLHGPLHPEIPPGGIPGAGSAASIGRGLSHLGPYSKNLDSHAIGHGVYDQGPAPLSHPGVPRTSQGEHHGGSHPGLFDSPSGMMSRLPPHQLSSNFMEAEIIPNHRSSYLDRGPFDRPSDLPLKFRTDGPHGLDSSSGLGLRNERFRPLHEEHMKPLPMELSRHAIDRREFEDIRQFPQPSSDAGSFLKGGSYMSLSRPIEGGPHGLGMDAAPRPFDNGPRSFNYEELGPNAKIGQPRFLPPFHHDDINGRSQPEFIGHIPGFGRRRLDGKSPIRDYPGIPPRGFGGLSGAPGIRSGLDDIDARDSRPFGEGSKPFNLSNDLIGNPFHERRFPGLPNRLHRGDLDGPGNLHRGDDFVSGPHSHLRNRDLLGHDMLPSHLRRGEPFGPHNLPGHLRLGEAGGFSDFPSHGRMGDLAGPGHFPVRPRLGEPGFRSSFSRQEYPIDGIHTGEMESFDNPRKRKQGSMGWCRICRVDCETVEGLDMHSQTKEHQKMAMDMVLSIKQKNKKHKTSSDHPLLEEASKSRNALSDGHGAKH